MGTQKDGEEEACKKTHLEANEQEMVGAKGTTIRMSSNSSTGTTGHMLSEGNEAYITDGPWRVPPKRKREKERGCLLQSLAITKPASHLISSLPATQFACLPYGCRVHARAARALMKK